MSCGKPKYALFPPECPYMKIYDGCLEKECSHHVYSLNDLLCLETAPLVSILMPYYNSHATLAKAVQSILEQDYPNWELVIVDDGSSPFSSKSLQVELNRIVPASIPQQLLVLTQENYGQAHARNTAFINSSGEYIAYLDADDEWEPNHLSSKLCKLLNEKGDIVYGNFKYKYYMDNYDKSFIEYKPRENFSYGFDIVGHEYDLIKKSNFIAINTVMHTRRLFVFAGGFEEGVICGEDGVLWRRMLESGAHIVFDSNYTSYYCRYDKSIQVEHQSLVLKPPAKINGIHLIGKGSNGQELDIQETYMERVNKLRKALDVKLGLSYAKD